MSGAGEDSAVGSRQSAVVQGGFDKAADQALRATFSKLLDPKLRNKKLANRVGKILLRHRDETGVFSAMIPAMAIVLCRPDFTKQEAAAVARQFGEYLAKEIEHYHEDFAAMRREFGERENWSAKELGGATDPAGGGK